MEGPPNIRDLLDTVDRRVAADIVAVDSERRMVAVDKMRHRVAGKGADHKVVDSRKAHRVVVDMKDHTVELGVVGREVRGEVAIDVVVVGVLVVVDPDTPGDGVQGARIVFEVSPVPHPLGTSRPVDLYFGIRSWSLPIHPFNIPPNKLIGSVYFTGV